MKKYGIIIFSITYSYPSRAPHDDDDATSSHSPSDSFEGSGDRRDGKGRTTDADTQSGQWSSPSSSCEKKCSR